MSTPQREDNPANLWKMIDHLERIVLAQKIHVSELEGKLAIFKQAATVFKQLAEEDENHA